MTLEGRQDEGGFKFYHYDPSIAGAAVFILLFLGTTVFHSWQMFRTRCWVAIPLVVGGLLEIIGYVGRAISGRQSPDWTLGPYIIQAIFLLVAPALFAATIYMEFGRLVTRTDAESYTVVKHKWITKIFVAGDVLSFVLQGGGGGYQSSGSLQALDTGSRIIIVGLFVQLAFFGFFMVSACAFHRRLVRQPTIRSRSGWSCPWRKHLYTMYGASLLIMVRSIFRAVEYLQGNDGYILSHEVYLYALDALLMFAMMVLFNAIHPSEIVAPVKSEEGSRDTLDVHLERYYQGL
ncbi:hypothetical protein WHR41_08376 [Cladosporium halotolerans]|uniref:Uncharacterized protein n=1 Tax=Cladosporium halotolerans TaxID=1052096 RepID=A0AB34KCZ4_9PEZI